MIDKIKAIVNNYIANGETTSEAIYSMIKIKKLLKDGVSNDSIPENREEGEAGQESN